MMPSPKTKALSIVLLISAFIFWAQLQKQSTCRTCLVPVADVDPLDYFAE